MLLFVLILKYFKRLRVYSPLVNHSSVLKIVNRLIESATTIHTHTHTHTHRHTHTQTHTQTHTHTHNLFCVFGEILLR